MKRSAVPSGWVVADIGTVCEPPQYGWTTRAAESTSALRLLRTTDISSGQIDWSTVPACDVEPPKRERYLLQSGDIVVSRAGSIGLSTLIAQPPPAVFASYLIRFRPAADINPRFVAWFMKSPAYWRQVWDQAAGIALQNINAKKLMQIQIPVAPLAEQGRIVAAIEEHLSWFDAAVAGLKRVRAMIHPYRVAVLKAAVEGRLVAKGGPWSRQTVGQLAVKVDYGTSARAAPEGDVPILRMGNIVAGELDLRSLRYLPASHPEFPKLFLEPGDLLFNRTNSAELVGKTALYGGKPAPCSFASYLIRVRLNSDCLPAYLSVFLNSVYGRNWVAGVVSQQVGQANVSGRKLKALSIPVPTPAEQERILAEVERRMTLVEAVRKECDAALARAGRLRQAILKRGFDGRLVPQDPGDEPANSLLGRIRASRAAAGTPRQKRKPARA